MSVGKTSGMNELQRQFHGPVPLPNQAVSDVPWLELPVDFGRRRKGGLRTATETVTLHPALSQSLRDLGQTANSSLTSVLLAGVGALLMRYTGQDEIPIGIPSTETTANEAPGAEAVSLLRLEIPPDSTFAQLVPAVHAAFTQTAQKEKLPTPSRDSYRDSSGSETRRDFQVLFTVLHNPGERVRISECSPSVDFDLYWQIADHADEILVSLQYDADLFSAPTIQRMLLHLRTLLSRFADHRNARISTLSLLTDAEYRQLVQEWNNTSTAYPRDLCMHHLVERQVERTPDAVAVQFRDETLTYRALDERANQLAHYLRKQGVGPDVPVGICLDRSLDLAIALLAVLKSGGVCVPLDSQYPRERLTYILSDAHVALLIAEETRVRDLRQATAKIVDLAGNQAIKHESCQRPSSGVMSDNLAYIIYTSGSTGQPRGVALPHRGLVNHNLAAIELYGLRSQDRVLQFSSISFDISVEEIFPTLMSGGTVVFRSPETPLAVSGFLSWIEQQQITLLDLPTAYWHELVHALEDTRESLPPSLRMIVVGGEKASASTFASWLRMTKGSTRWLNTYGPTEASVIATYFEPSYASPDEVPASLPIGRPIANTQVYLLDQHLSPVPVGLAGELHIGGDGVARGYLNRPEMTTARFIPDPFSEREGALLYRTGDLARYLPDGNIEFLGRRDFQVKIRGFRVEPGEIEAALTLHPNVQAAVVVAQTTGLGEKYLVAYIVSDRAEAVPPGQLTTFLKERLPDYMVPSRFVAVDVLPLTPNGKVDRGLLEKRLLPQVATVSIDRVTDPVVSQLLGIWRSVLETDLVGPDDNFWELGGQSLLAARLMQKIDRAFGKKLTMASLIQAPTINLLADVIKSDRTQAWPCLVPLETRGSRPPFFCVHGIGGSCVGFRTLAALIGNEQPFYGVQAQGLDGRPCLTRIEDMAERYLQEVRALQPVGPYYLGGFSFGGWVAYEMAQQLTLKGEQVAFVGLLDTYPFRLQPVTSSLMSFFRVPSQQQLMYVLPKTLGKGIRRRLVWLRLPAEIKRVQRACYEAERLYRLKPYSGDVTLFRATGSLKTSVDPLLRWSELALGGVDVQEVEGHHGDIIIEPVVRRLADKLRSSLERAQQRYSIASCTPDPLSDLASLGRTVACNG